MPQHYQLLKTRLINIGPSTTAHLDYAKYLLSILVLLKIFYAVGPVIHAKSYIIVNMVGSNFFYLNCNIKLAPASFFEFL